MKKRFAAFLLALGLMVHGSTVFSRAETGKNAYGHTVTYLPVTGLYTDGEPVRLFDAGVTDWGNAKDIADKEAESVKWLSDNGYLLNHFGRRLSGELNDCLNSNGEWLGKIKGNVNSKKWSGDIKFFGLIEKERRSDGNISNMYDKGDIEYFLSWKVKTVQTRWGLRDKSNDIGLTYVFDELVRSSGGGWKKYNTLGDGPNLYYDSAWKSADKLSIIGFTAMSDKDNRVDSYLSGAMLVGRDIKGPAISSVRVTKDIEGKEELENGTLSLENIDSLKDRTLYFHVEWDEPVKFNGLSDEEIAKLYLDVETIGIDGTSGLIAQAPFLRFAPGKKDAKPVMIFEYKVGDPYTDSSHVTQERGFFYRFSKVTVSENENKALWSNIYDLSGNRFASDKNGMQPSGKVSSPVAGSVKVDLAPFGIKNIRLTKDLDASNAFIKANELLSITLELNKPLKKSVSVTDLPAITLNIKDFDGKNIKIAPGEGDLKKYILYNGKLYWTGYYFEDGEYVKPVTISSDRKSITYRVQLYIGYTAEEKTVKITSVTSGKGSVTDDSGYTLMNYEIDGELLSPLGFPAEAKSREKEYKVSPDKEYRFDFEAPVVNITAEDIGNGVIMVKADADDKSLEGCDASFTLKVTGESDGALSYQASSSGAYRDSAWESAADGSGVVSFGSPVIANANKGTAYGFIKLPEKSEAEKIEISVYASDEAGNGAEAKKTLAAPEWKGHDTLAPRISTVTDGENITVTLSDIDEDAAYYYGFSDDGVAEPSYKKAASKLGVIEAPALSGGEVYKKVVWIKSEDSSGNVSEPYKINIKYDRTYASVSINADTERDYYIGEYPTAEVLIQNAKAYWYAWAEVPAGVTDMAAYIEENCLSELKNHAMIRESIADSDPDTPQSNNEKAFNAALVDTDTGILAHVAKINPEDETYGDDIHPDNTTRPIMLVVAAEKDDGETLIKTVRFNTIYSAPDVMLRQSRFSTNSQSGKRLDYIRNSENAGLIWADDDVKNPINTPALFGFAEAEFYLEGDPVTGLTRVDTDKSTLYLEKVKYSSSDGAERDRTVIAEWKLSDISDGKNPAAISIDPAAIETVYEEVGEDGEYLNVRYEFTCSFGYTGGLDPEKKKVTSFAFNNAPTGYVGEIAYDMNDWTVTTCDVYRYDKKNTEAVFDKSGNDVTKDIPVYSFRTETADKYGYRQFITFAMPENSNCSGAYYFAPVQNAIDSENKTKLCVDIGTEPDNLSARCGFYDEYGKKSERFYIDGLLKENNGIKELKLYYRFSHPESGTFSPVYVLKLRQDNVMPVYDITISETERPAKEVLVKVNSVTDTQTASNGTLVTDTPASGLNTTLNAWRYASGDEDVSLIPDEDKNGYFYEDGDGNEYGFWEIRVRPDEDGIYRFTTNGYFDAESYDYAGNRNLYLIINGEYVDFRTEDGWNPDMIRYHVKNVDNSAPGFENEPIVTANKEKGSFTLEALVSENTEAAYIRFDSAYQEILGGGSEARYDILNVPGRFSGGVDKETGKLSAEIYIKPSEITPLSEITLIIENAAGYKAEYVYKYESPLFGKKAEITNAKNEDSYPVYAYGGTLDFSSPVMLDGETEYMSSHSGLPVYSDGVTEVEFRDIFGSTYSESIYADIFGPAFNHSLIFTANGEKIDPDKKVSADVSVKIDLGGNEKLTLDGEKDEYLFTENGTLTYTLKNLDLNKTKTFSFPIANIDKEAPKATVNYRVESDRNLRTGEELIYSVTYSIEGFSEENVMLTESSPSSITFDCELDDLIYTFRFRDEAGNEGEYTADASGIAFSKRGDRKIAHYRLTYLVPDENGYKTVGITEDGAGEIDFGPVNKAVSVKIDAFNAKGEPVSFTVLEKGELPDGTRLYTKEKLLLFETEDDREREAFLTLNTAEGKSDIRISLPGGTIDLTAPTGTVYYEMIGEDIRAYLSTNEPDLTEDSVYVTGKKADGMPLKLMKDEKGYYTEFDLNGAGKFLIADKAGNIGSVMIAVLSIDKEAPEVISEGWQSKESAVLPDEVRRLLETPTNSTVKLFMTFNEQLSGADVKAFADSERKEELKPTADYVTAETAGTTLTVEFKQNCLAMVTVYDLRGNARTLLRPEDGPVTVIDRDIPKVKEGYPKTQKNDDNTVTMEYAFKDGEKVMLLSAPDEGYNDTHIITFGKNGAHTLSFADRAGNVFSDYPVITGIDMLAPSVKINVDYVGEGATLSPEESYKAGNVYTSRNVRILLNVEDETADGITVTAKTRSGKSIKLNREKTVTEDKKTYNYNFIVTENGSYTVTAKDKWGHENVIETSVSTIDRTAPTVRFINGKTVIAAYTDEKEAEKLIMENILTSDQMSGKNAPIGNRYELVTDGVTVTLDMSGADLSKPGSYEVLVTAADRLNNKTEKYHTVVVTKDAYKFTVNNEVIFSGDVFTSKKGKITLERADEGTNYYFSEGYKTAAEMKYAISFDPGEGFEAAKRGYYTVLAQGTDRKMHLLYVYVN